jgi:hypothetical protein
LLVSPRSFSAPVIWLRVHSPEAKVSKAQRPGTYKTTWKMTDESGREYFPTHYKDGIFCIMTVVGPH